MKYLSILLTLCCFITLAHTTAHAKTPCHVYDKSQTSFSGFGVAFNVNSNIQEVLLHASCKVASSTATLHVGNTLGDQYIYEQGYVLQNGTWKPITYDGIQKTNSWIKGEAQVTLPFTNSEMIQDTYFLAYVCDFVSGEWKCGCRDKATCSDQGTWQLQKIDFAVDSVADITERRILKEAFGIEKFLARMIRSAPCLGGGGSTTSSGGSSSTSSGGSSSSSTSGSAGGGASPNTYYGKRVLFPARPNEPSCEAASHLYSGFWPPLPMGWEYNDMSAIHTEEIHEPWGTLTVNRYIIITTNGAYSVACSGEYCTTVYTSSLPKTLSFFKTLDEGFEKYYEGKNYRYTGFFDDEDRRKRNLLYAEAEKFFKEARSIIPESVLAREWLALALLRQEKLQEAKRALRENPDIVLTTKGHYYVNNKNEFIFDNDEIFSLLYDVNYDEESLRLVLERISVAPNDAELYVILGKVYSHMKNTTMRDKLFELATKIDPDLDWSKYGRYAPY